MHESGEAKEIPHSWLERKHFTTVTIRKKLSALIQSNRNCIHRQKENFRRAHSAAMNIIQIFVIQIKFERLGGIDSQLLLSCRENNILRMILKSSKEICQWEIKRKTYIFQ